jgi:hypothetical protein
MWRTLGYSGIHLCLVFLGCWRRNVEIETGVFWCWKSTTVEGNAGLFFVPEGRNRQGWSRFFEELRSVLQFSAQSWEVPKEKRRFAEVLMDSKEGPKAPMVVQASSQGKEMTVTGVHAFSSSFVKCLSEEEGKKKDVGKLHSCCAGYLSEDGRGTLLNQLELLHVEIFKCMEKLKLCRCCPQLCGQGEVGPRKQETSKEAQVKPVVLDSNPEEDT